MLRLSRHLATALFWLAIALLPLRGGIAAAMPVAMGAGQSHAVPLAQAEPGHGMTAACDEPGAESSAHMAGNEHGSAPHTCSVCALCPSAVAVTAAWHITAMPVGAPRVDAARDFVCAVLDTPERPPRRLPA